MHGSYEDGFLKNPACGALAFKVGPGKRKKKRKNATEMSAVLLSGRHADVVTSSVGKGEGRVSRGVSSFSK